MVTELRIEHSGPEGHTVVLDAAAVERIQQQLDGEAARLRACATLIGATTGLYPVPRLSEFRGGFALAADLDRLARLLIERHKARFGFLRQLQVHYRWRAKGGHSQGEARYGAVQRVSGLLAYYSSADLVLWLARDYCSEFNSLQVEAVLFHQLSHVAWDEERAAAVLIGHEFAGFRAELEAYGPWTADLRAAGETFRQLPLWPDDEDEGEDEGEAV